MEFDSSKDLSSKIYHVGITAPTEQFESLISFYKSALAPMKYKEIMRFPGAVGLGDAVPDFWISETESDTPQNLHFAFTADGMHPLPLASANRSIEYEGLLDRKTVDAFHEAALSAGGKCNGKPGLRTQYHANYYAAFVWDPRGNNVEIVSDSAGHCRRAGSVAVSLMINRFAMYRPRNSE